jgi:uridine kinase
MIIIGISGASCSGKSWLAKKIKEVRPDDIGIFNLDSYYKDVAYVNQLDCRHDNPESVDYDLVLEDLELLLSGKEIRLPVYDYETHKVVGESICMPTPILIIEGLFVFTDKRLLDKMDLKIWVDADETLRYKRRLNRDLINRGDNIEEINTRYQSDVKPAFEKYIKPYKQYAQIIYLNNLTKKEDISSLTKIILSFLNFENIKSIHGKP